MAIIIVILVVVDTVVLVLLIASVVVWMIYQRKKRKQSSIEMECSNSNNTACSTHNHAETNGNPVLLSPSGISTVPYVAYLSNGIQLFK